MWMRAVAKVGVRRVVNISVNLDRICSTQGRGYSQDCRIRGRGYVKGSFAGSRCGELVAMLVVEGLGRIWGGEKGG